MFILSRKSGNVVIVAPQHRGPSRPHSTSAPTVQPFSWVTLSVDPLFTNLGEGLLL